MDFEFIGKYMLYAASLSKIHVFGSYQKPIKLNALNKFKNIIS